MAINIHVLTFILCAIFTVFSVILIFKNDLFDGGRLLVSTKPISRSQIMLCKLLVYFTVTIFTVFVSLIIVATVLFLPSARTDIDLYDSLFVSILIDGLLLFFVFGGIAILLVSFVNQIGLMICMIGGAVGFAVFDIIAPSITFSNAELITRRTGAKVDTYKFVDYQGNMQTIASLNNPDLDLKSE
jgi:ABC-type transport system involved in multi-copper enzyme maturation permease subunit